MVMFNVVFFSIEITASLIGGLIAGLASLILLRRYEQARKTMEKLSGKTEISGGSVFLLFAVLVGLIHGLAMGIIRFSGLIGGVSLLDSTPLFLPFTILYSVGIFVGIWNYLSSKKEREERNQWIKVAVLYSFILNIVSGFLTFLIAMTLFFV